MHRHVRSRTAWSAVAVVSAVAVGMLALPHGAAAAEATTTPARYVRQACAAINAWNSTSDDDSALLKALTANKKTAKSTRQALAALYAKNVNATDTLIASTKAIGIPRLADGQQVAGDYVQTLSDIRAAYKSAQDAVTRASVTNGAALASAVGPIDQALTTQLGSVGDPLTVLNTDPALASAVQTDNGCGQVVAGYKSTYANPFKVGDCISAKQDTVACTQPHDSEVTLVSSYPASSSDPFPGNDAIQSFVDQNCIAAFSSYVGISPDQSSHVYGWISPSAGGDWNSGDRTIVCTATNSDSTPITGSLEGQAS